MAINKALLLNMLMNSAPLLMQALTTRDRWNYGEDPLNEYTLDDLNTLHNKGYDMGLVQDYMTNTSSNFNYIQDAAQNAISQIATEATDRYSSNGINAHFPSDSLYSEISPTEIYNRIREGYDTPALKSAFSMLYGSKMPKPKRKNTTIDLSILDDYDDLPF